MVESTVVVPFSVLNHAKLSPGAKRLWAVLLTLSFPRRVRVADLMGLTGATRKSVVTQLALLKQQGLLLYEHGRWKDYEIKKLFAQEPQAGLALPIELIQDHRVSGAGLLVWASLTKGGTQLKAGSVRPTVQRQVKLLKKAAWVSDENQPQNPFAQERQKELGQLSDWVATLQQKESCSYSQALMVAMLTLQVDDDDFVIESEKKYLTNPTTDNMLRYDLHWPGHRQAFEFHGPQHFGLTKKFPNKDEFLVRRQRDLIKLGLSQEKGVTVKVLAYPDLTWERVRQVTEGLPQRDLTGKQHLVRQLADWAQEHRQTMSNIKVTPVE